MECKIGFPMVLIDRIKNLGESSPQLETYINEYWSPTKGWKYLEYLNSNMTITEILPAPDRLLALKGNFNYTHDFDLAKRLFP